MGHYCSCPSCILSYNLLLGLQTVGYSNVLSQYTGATPVGIRKVNVYVLMLLVVQTITKQVGGCGDSQFTIVSTHFPGEIEENSKNLSIVSLLTQMQNKHF